MKPLAYIVLGIPGAGRREILCDLIEDQYDPLHPVTVMLHPEEPHSPYTTRLQALPFVALHEWTFHLSALGPPAMAAEPAPDRDCFILAHGLANPVDQLEGWKYWLTRKGLALARVLTVVHGTFLLRHPEAETWYDACIHFSDVVLLHRRPAADHASLQAFRQKYAKAFFPCVFEIVKNGHVRNPAFILSPESRRISQLFEEEAATPLADWPDPLDLGPDETDEDEEPINLQDDPFLARLPTGQRRRRIPDIAPLWSAEDSAG